jgi:tRNA-dihydrouridine synthase
VDAVDGLRQHRDHVDRGAGGTRTALELVVRQIAAASLGIPTVLSTQASVPMERVATKGGGGPLWFQLYLQHDRGFTRELVRRAEQAGIQLVTIHGRTRMQFYEGRADWDAIRPVRDAVSIPLIANGDVETPDDAAEILRRSGADAVMVGRGAQGQPWLPAVLAGHAPPEAAEIADIAVEHYELMLEFYGIEAGLRHARKHLGWYLDRFAAGMHTDDKVDIMTSKNTGQVTALLRSALQQGAELSAARKAA